jgi:phosphodiesterase/alkaline phosphatase D-like protein
VDPNEGAVSDCHFEYGPTASYGTSVPCSALPGSGNSAVAVSATLKSLSANTTYHVRVVATNAGGTSFGSDETFKTLPNAPTVVTKAASAVTQTAATVNATVDPNEGAVSDCHFEYGPTASYGTSVPCSALPGSGNSAVAVSAAIGSLSANATYHFRIVATNAGGTSDGSDQTLKTLPNPPTVVTGTAFFPPTQTTATLNASVNPNGGEVSSCHFEYGEKETYGFSVSCTPSPGSGSGAVAVSGALTSLTKNTKYHFRIVATNSGGTNTGSDQTFETAPGPPTIVAEGASEITPTTALLHATAELRGGKIRQCYFDVFDKATLERVFSKGCTQPRESGKVELSTLAEELLPETAYYFRVIIENNFGEDNIFEEQIGKAEEFKTHPGPTIVTGTASLITQTSAVLNATVNPNEGAVSDCHFEYGPTTGYGTSVPCSALPGSGSSPVKVSASVTGLSPNTTYHFRIVSTNSGGTSLGADHTFTALPNAPAVVTGAVSSVTPTSATLNATVNPNDGGVSDCHFEYGTSTAYGTSAPCSSLPGSGNSPVAVSASVSGLGANATYYLRIVATNAGGTTTDTVGQTFTTTPNPTVVVAPAQSSSTSGVAGFTTTALAATGTVSLVSASITTQRSGLAAIGLSCAGSAQTCGGKLTLTAKSKAKAGRKSSRSMIIGTVSFSIASGKATIVRLRLNATGRSLLSAGRGRISATLAILKFFPGPSQTKTETVRLTLQKTSSLKKRK